MPTMREVAVALRIDLNTVRRAYDELERMGAITLLRGRGSFVSTEAAQVEPPVLASRAEQIARQALAAAVAAGVDPRTIAERILALGQGGATS
jgi:GntR family transcriptional regulator